MTSLPYDYDSDARRPRAAQELIDLAHNPGLIRALVTRNLKIRYKRSLLGIAWTMVNPAAMMILLTVVFSRAFAREAPVYPAYVLPGLLLWNFFSQTTMTIGAEVAAGVDLWRRVRMPKTALALSATITGLVNVCLALVPLLLILALLGRPVGLALLTLPATLVAMSLFVLGLGLTMSAIAVYFPDVVDIYAVVLSGWMFATPIIYPMAIVPPAIQRILRWNPMTVYVEGFRAPLYQNASPPASDLALMFGLGATMLVLGWISFTRCADDIPYRG